MAQLTPSDLDAGAIRDVTERVLAGPDYAQAQPGPLTRLVDAVLDRVADVIGTLLSPRGSGVGVALLAVAVATVALIAWTLLRRVRRDRARAPVPGRIGGRTAQDWQRAAERYAADADWASALRCHYRALLADLVAAGLVDEVAGRTARGYQRDIVAATPDAGDAMTTVTAAFEAAWYGHRDVTAADVTVLQAAAAAVRRHLLVPA